MKTEDKINNESPHHTKTKDIVINELPHQSKTEDNNKNELPHQPRTKDNVKMSCLISQRLKITQNCERPHRRKSSEKSLRRDCVHFFKKTS